MEEEKISLKTAECLYTGIVHDTGVFKYSSASKRTMEIAGCLMEKGVKFQEIIDGSFYRRTYGQNRLLGNTVLKSELLDQFERGEFEPLPPQGLIRQT